MKLERVPDAPRCWCGGRLVDDSSGADPDVSVMRCVACGYARTTFRDGPDRVCLQQEHPSAHHDDAGLRFAGAVSWLRAHFAATRARHLVSGGATRVLDFGCGQGFLLDALSARGVHAQGVEISDATARRARSRGHAVAHDVRALAGLRFDAVTAIHVLEHLPDPQRALAELRGVLSPGAHFEFEVPNAASWQARLFGRRWMHREAGLHVHQFTPRALDALLAGGGWRVERRTTWSLEQGLFGWIQSAYNVALPYNRFFRSVLLNRPLRERLRCWPELLLLPLVLVPAVSAWLADGLAGRGAVLCVRGRVGGQVDADVDR